METEREPADRRLARVKLLYSKSNRNLGRGGYFFVLLMYAISSITMTERTIMVMDSVS